MNIATIYRALPELATPRLTLRRITPDDVDDIFAYASDPDIARTTTWLPHKTRQDSVWFVRHVRQLYREHKVAPWGIHHPADNRLIGTCGYTNWTPRHGRAEIGYALARPYWSLGLMTEAVNAVINFGFEQMVLNRIYARCLPENIGSARVMEKCGMVYEGTMRQYANIKGSYRDLKLYAILREEWTADR